MGTNTEILLSQTQQKNLKAAVESPRLRTSDTDTVRRADSGDSTLII
jgi:hypothetical protein